MQAFLIHLLKAIIEAVITAIAVKWAEWFAFERRQKCQTPTTSSAT